MDKNYLEYIPKLNSRINFEEKNGKLIVIIPKEKFYEKIIAKILKSSPNYKLHLDDLGSFVLKNIDGDKNIYEIAQNVKLKFDKKAEPLYERLINYIEILRKNKIIEIRD